MQGSGKDKYKESPIVIILRILQIRDDIIDKIKKAL